MTYLKLKKFTDAEIRGLKEYVRVMEPIALALDFIQGDQVHLGHLLPLIVKTGNNVKIIMEENLLYCGPLAECIYKSLETRFHHLFDDRNHILASISNPAFKTRFLKLQSDKDRAIRYLREEVNALNKNNTPSTSNTEKEKKSSKQTSSLVHFDDDIYHETY